MSFDTTTRNRLSKFVGEARELLTDEFTNQFQQDYGMNPKTGEVTDLERLSHLDDRRRQTAIILRETLAHYYANLPTKNRQPTTDYRQLIQRIVREQAFTILNRLCAIRMAEARDLVVESVGSGVRSKGFQLYQYVVGTSLGDTGAAYQQFLLSLFDEFAVDLPVLFDRFSPSGRLFPRETVLTQLIALINDPEINQLWGEDETIGWIYQYFNSKEERKAMRDASQAPRNSRELAVRNQFFTPRYVVEFLTDNTLGRIWYEMRQGETRLKDECKYLVRRPDEVFFSEQTNRSSVFFEEEVAAESKKLTDADSEFPEYTAEDMPHIWQMINLGQTINGTTTGSDPRDWRRDEVVVSGEFEKCTTQRLLEFLNMSHAVDNFLGDAGVYEKQYFVDACNEVRRRVLHARSNDISQDELLNSPVFIEHRPLKDPREIRMLDPACGSMHFGLYAFDLFLRIYEEFWDLISGGHWHAVSADYSKPFTTNHYMLNSGEEPLTSIYADKAAFLRDVPRLIIEHNIHGIDIDPRAVQIAGLSLWLRAQRAWKSQGLAAGDRPKITRSNVVCAEPMPGDRQQLEAFCKELHPAIAQMVTAIFEEMKLAGEAGSLLKIEQEISYLVAAAKKQWLAQPKATQLQLFADGQVIKEQQLEFDLSGITDDQFFEKAEEEIYKALRQFAEQTESKHGFRRKLFANDAQRGFSFIDQSKKRFNVILMNPPFGDEAKSTKKYISDNYADGKSDMGAAFVSRGLELLTEGGKLGAITNRTLIAVQGFSAWREQLSSKNRGIDVLVDLGHGVLDAMVETAMYIVAKGYRESPTAFLGLLSTSNADKHGALSSEILNFEWRDIADFNVVSGRPWAYWVPKSLLKKFLSPSFLGSGGQICQGTATADDFRFYRLQWEVPRSSINFNPNDKNTTFETFRWSPIAKGGGYALWWDDIHLVQDWKNNGWQLKNFLTPAGKPKSFLKNLDKLFIKGLTYPYRTTSTCGFRLLPPGCSFSVGGWAMFPPPNWTEEQALAIYNSRIARYYMEVLLGQGDTSESGTAARNHVSAAVGGIPWPKHSAPLVDDQVRELVDIQAASTMCESDLFFNPWQHFDLAHGCFDDILDSWWKRTCDLWRSTLKKILSVEEAVFESYKMTSRDIDTIDNSEGCSFSSLPRRELESSVIAEIFSLSTEELTKRAKAACGAKRYTVKKSYYVSRAIDLASHILKVHPESVIDAGEKAGAEMCGQRAPFALGLVSCLIGHAIGIFPKEVGPTGPSNCDYLPFDTRGVQADGKAVWVSDKDSKDDFSLLLREQLASKFPAISDLEEQLCNSIATRSLTTFINDPSEFFDFHCREYSRSRRSAPIYWPLSTESGSYTLWFYYHRLTDQTLYKAVNDFVDPKLKQTTRQLTELRAIKDRSTTQENDLASLSELESELEQFKADLLEIAAFWKPNLNDGVQITAAPLHKFFRHKAWSKKLKTTWEELQSGKYDWAHLALSIWPDRVIKQAAHKDRSIAIAHDLEDQLWHEVEIKKTSKTGKVTTKLEWQPKPLTEAELDEIVRSVVGGR